MDETVVMRLQGGMRCIHTQGITVLGSLTSKEGTLKIAFQLTMASSGHRLKFNDSQHVWVVVLGVTAKAAKRPHLLFFVADVSAVFLRRIASLRMRLLRAGPRLGKRKIRLS